MNKQVTRKIWERVFTLITLATAATLAVFFCLVLYQVDNKYTALGPQGESGILYLDEQALESYPVIFLTEGWEYYAGALLTPEDFAADPPTPTQYLFIGQYGGFEAGDLSASPHGSATYRLTIQLPQTPRDYILELPEIFSAYRAYVNGKLVQLMGDPDPASYHPQTGNRTVMIEAGGQVELLIAVSDFSHFYSGITYPPAFGQPEAVSLLLNTRLILRSLLVAFALAISLLALVVGFISKKNTLAISYSLLCLFFIGYTLYPLTKTLVDATFPFYAIEQFSYPAILVMAMMINRKILHRTQKWDWGFIGLGLGVCAAAVVMTLMLPDGNLRVMIVYTTLIAGFGWITAAYLVFTTALAVWQSHSYSKAMLHGFLVFGTALVMNRLLPMYEPIATGWFTELACFVLVLCIGYVVARSVAIKYQESFILEERTNSLVRLTELQKSSFEMLSERIEETKMLRHDMRHHFTMINAFIKNRDYDSLIKYVSEFTTSIENAAPLQYTKNPVVNALIQHYAQCAKEQGIKLTLHLGIDQETIVSEVDLCAILSNLLENSLEACARQKDDARDDVRDDARDDVRFVNLSVSQKASMLVIQVVNSTDGKIREREGAVLSSKAKGRKGYGLESVKALAEHNNGKAEFNYDNEKGLFTSTVLLMRQTMSPPAARRL